MKLSEAMRLGAMLRPQAFGRLYSETRTGFLGLFGPRVKTSCALGAAYEAGNVPIVRVRPGGASTPCRGSSKAADLAYEPPPDWWRLLTSHAVCPDCPLTLVVSEMIPHLNDEHRWPRPTIADFIATLEAASVPSTDPPSPSAAPATAETVAPDEAKL